MAQFKGADAPPENYSDGYKSITNDDSKRLLSVLASPAFAGRGTGQIGYVKAAHFVAGKLAAYGFEPIGDNGTYFQNVAGFETVTADLKESSITLGDLTIKGPTQLGFVGYGRVPKVSGKVAVVNVRGEVTRANVRLLNLTDRVVILRNQSNGRSVRSAILSRRPAALIHVAEDDIANRPQSRRGNRRSSIEASISLETANKLAKAAGIDTKLLADSEKDGIQTGESDKSVTVEQRQVVRPSTVPNVVGWLPGSDPQLRHEYVTIGAHLDHLGKRGDSVYPGADDNGSGSTALLQIAKALHLAKNKPKRSVLYIGFAAEEMGLVGSRFYCQNPLKPLKDMVCMLNIDMIGRNEETANERPEDNQDTIHLVGSKKANMKMHELILECNKYVKFRFEYDEEKVFMRSDQASFARNGIPVAFLFGGFSPYYHRPTDTLEGINYDKISNAARLYYLAIMLATERGKFPAAEVKPQ